MSIDLSRIEVGDEVRSCLAGWGTVERTHPTNGEIAVVFKQKSCDFKKIYHYDGRHHKCDLYPEIVEVQKKGWVPQEGDYIICTSGDISSINPDVKETLSVEGRAYPTRELAKKAYSMIRPYQRLIAWILENDPDNDFENGLNVITIDLDNIFSSEKYFFSAEDASKAFDICSPRISSIELADELADDLNSGKLVL